MKITELLNLYGKQFVNCHDEPDNAEGFLSQNKVDISQLSDGYHTFAELYEHRIELFIALCRELFRNYEITAETAAYHGYHGFGNPVWRSKLHSDGTGYDGWFIMGIGKEPAKQITYHLPMSKWDETEFAEELDNAPEWDNHTSEDVLNRLKQL